MVSLIGYEKEVENYVSTLTEEDAKRTLVQVLKIVLAPKVRIKNLVGNVLKDLTETQAFMLSDIERECDFINDELDKAKREVN